MPENNLKEVTIDGKTWFRGSGSADSQLLKTDGRMCCLGFAALACGAYKHQIFRVSSPVDIFGPYEASFKLDNFPEFERFLVKYQTVNKLQALRNNDTVNEMMVVNDNNSTNDAFKVEKLTQLAKSIGLDFKFINVNLESTNE